MSSTTGSRHNCEQGQGYSPTTKPQGGLGKAPPQAPPHRGGGGGDTMGWGGEGGCGSPASYMGGGGSRT